MNIYDYKYKLCHGGPGSGRYPLGSGERPYQHRLGGKLAKLEAKEASAKNFKKSVKYGEKAFKVRDQIFREIYKDRIDGAKQLGYEMEQSKYSYGDLTKEEGIKTSSGSASLRIDRAEPRSPLLEKEQIERIEKDTKKHYSSIEKDAIKLVEKEAQEIANDWHKQEVLERYYNTYGKQWAEEKIAPLIITQPAPTQKVGKNMKVETVSTHLDDNNNPEIIEIHFSGSEDVGYHWFITEYDIKHKKLSKYVEMYG